MPLSASGQLSLVASADIGGLGARNGTPILYTWVPPSLGPQLIPYVVMLALLALKSNRRAAAWLIWLPIIFVWGVTQVLPGIPPDGPTFLLDVIPAFAFGLAAVWLLGNKLSKSHRLLTFLCVLATLVLVSAVTLAAGQSWDQLSFEILSVTVLLGLASLVTTISLAFAGLISRKSYRPLKVYLSLLVLLGVIWLLTTSPFFVVASIFEGRVRWNEFLLPVLGAATANFLLLLPFLILSTANGFYRERFKALLNVKPLTPPVLPQVDLKT